MKNLPASVLSIVMVVIIIAIGAIVIDEFASTLDTEDATSVAWNVTQSGLGGMDTFGDWIDIIVIMVVIGVVIGLIYGVFRYVGGSAGY